MSELTDLIERLHRQQERDEHSLAALESKIVNVRESVATAKEEIGQLVKALAIAIRNGMVEASEMDIVEARLKGAPESCPEAVTEDDDTSEETISLEPDNSQLEDGAGQNEEEKALPSPRGIKSLIDTVFDIIQEFEGAFTTGDVRKKLAEQHPELFLRINPASISGTVARLFSAGNGIKKVGYYSDGWHYQREDTMKAQQQAPPITTNTGA